LIDNIVVIGYAKIASVLQKKSQMGMHVHVYKPSSWGAWS